MGIAARSEFSGASSWPVVVAGSRLVYCLHPGQAGNAQKKVARSLAES